MWSYTPEQIMTDAKPCEEWPMSRVRALFAAYERETVTVIDVLECSSLSDRNAVYQAVRMSSASDTRWLACIVAERALDRYDRGDPRSYAAIEVSRRYAQGGVTQEEMTAAWSAAGRAPGCGLGAASGSALGAAAGDAVRATAWAASGAALGAGAAAGAAVWAESRRIFLAMLNTDGSEEGNK